MMPNLLTDLSAQAHTTTSQSSFISFDIAIYSITIALSFCLMTVLVLLIHRWYHKWRQSVKALIDLKDGTYLPFTIPITGDSYFTVSIKGKRYKFLKPHHPKFIRRPAYGLLRNSFVEYVLGNTAPLRRELKKDVITLQRNEVSPETLHTILEEDVIRKDVKANSAKGLFGGIPTWALVLIGLVGLVIILWSVGLLDTTIWQGK